MGWLGPLSIAVGVVGLAHYSLVTRLIAPHSREIFPVYVLWVSSIAIWCVGLITHLALGAQAFSWVAMLGGCAWALSSSTLMYIVSTLGMALGPMLWTIVSLVAGWVFAHFGVLVAPERTPHPVMNYAGVAVCSASFFLYFFVRSKPANDEVHIAIRARVLGVLLALFSGVGYGFNTLPVVYASNHSSHSQIAFAFSHFSGILLTSTLFFLISAIWRKNRPHVPEKVFLQSILLGVIFGITQVAVFEANQQLEVVVALPIIVVGPNVITSLYSIFYFREIRDFKNLLILSGAFAVTVAGVVLVALSKK